MYRKSILIVKIGAIGDVVMAMSMLSALKDHEIMWVCGKIVAPLLKAAGVQVVEVDEKQLLAGRIWEKGWALLGLWRRLIGKKFDLVITAHPDPRYHWISKVVRAKERRSWNKVPGRYHAQQYVDLVGGKNVVLPEIRGRTFAFDRPFVAIAPGGAKNVLMDTQHRRWPIENYAALIEELAKNIAVVVTGADSDDWVRSFLPAGLFVDRIGKTDLLDMIGVFRSAKLMIAHDSGPLHLAKLAKCPIIGLFGPTDPADFAGDEVEAIWGGEGLSCRPCYDGKHFPKCANHVCMKSITVEQVLSRARKLILL